jgi:outer membrane protein OmpA-like peptidoglycan-associated protein
VADALSAFNNSELTSDARQTLSALGPDITKLGNHPAMVEAHTDSIDSADYNQRLSKRRAEAVKEWLARSCGMGTATG